MNLVNRSHPLAHGLTNWWLVPPDRAAGVKWFDLVNDVPSALTGISGVANVGFGVKGKSPCPPFGSFYSKDSTTYCYASYASPANCTLMAWAYFDGAFGFPNQGALLGAATGSGGGTDNAGATKPFVLGPTTFDYWDGSFVRTTSFTTTAPVSKWVHIAVTHTPGAQKCYLNGLANGSASNAQAVASGGTILPIGSNNGSNTLKGWVTDVRVYNRVLSAGDILQAYLNSLQGYPGLLLQQRGRLVLPPSPVGGYINPQYPLRFAAGIGA